MCIFLLLVYVLVVLWWPKAKLPAAHYPQHSSFGPSEYFFLIGNLISVTICSLFLSLFLESEQCSFTATHATQLYGNDWKRQTPHGSWIYSSRMGQIRLGLNTLYVELLCEAPCLYKILSLLWLLGPYEYMKIFSIHGLTSSSSSSSRSSWASG